MKNKRREDMVIGDFVTSGGNVPGVYEVTKVLKTQLEIKCWGVIARKGTSDNDARRITKKTGKLVGSYGNTFFRGLYEDETPDGLLKAAQEFKDKKAAEKAEREASAQATLQAVYEANSEMEIVDMEMGLRKVIFENKKGEKGMLIFSQTPDSIFDWDTREEVPAFRITSVAFTSRYNEPRSFGMPNDVTATRTFDGIIELIAGTYWE